MTTRVRFAVYSFLALVFFFSAASNVAVAQERKPEPHAAAQQNPVQPLASSQQPGINQQFGAPLAAQSKEAAGKSEPEKENAQEKMIEEMKESPSVRWMAEHLHLSPRAGYWVGIIFDFAILALLLIFALKKNLPSMFRSRTANIRQGIDEAQRASQEANRRLAEVEARLAKLDQEISAMRAAADQEAAAEEQRILAAAQEDKKRIVETAEAEITAAAKLARRELKAFAAELAVSLAERRIHVDAATDQALVRIFTGQLAAGKDGQ